MKKIVFLFALIASVMTANAQERGFYGNKFTDNWYIGFNGGVGTKTTHQNLAKFANENIGIRVGKLFSPVFGVGVEANGYFTNKADGVNEMFGKDWDNKLTTKKPFSYMQFGIFANANLTNAIKGYYGEPRMFEVQPLIGFYWGMNMDDNDLRVGTLKNTFVNKFAIDFDFNFGKKKEWQLYLEPSLNMVVAGVQASEVDENHVGNQIVLYNINNSFLQLNLGLNYKFLTSNGTHNFLVVEACDQTEMDELNNSINAMRKKNTDDEDKIGELQAEIERLKKALQDCDENNKYAQIKLSPVFYQCDKSVITPEQAQTVRIAGEAMQQYPQLKINIKGYASPEGPHGNNTSLGIRRANAVKEMLMKDYGIAEDRITAEGCGETDQLFKVFELNRVAMLYLDK